MSGFSTFHDTNLYIFPFQNSLPDIHVYIMRQKSFHLYACVIVLFITFSATVAVANDTKNSAVVLAYYRIDEDIFPNSSLKFDTFKAHIDDILSGGYTVLPLPDIIQRLQNNTPIAPKTLAITFEGGYRSILNEAVPLLEEYDLPYTVFYSSAAANTSSHQHLSWEELQYLSDNPLTQLGVSSQHYQALPPLAMEEQKRRINTSIAEHRKRFGSHPALFSYPDGQWTPALQAFIQGSGFTAALGIQSGAASPNADLYALPRFTMTESYSNIERFKMVTTARPLPAFDILPQGTIPSSNTPHIGFSVNMPQEALKPLSCFTSGQDRPAIDIIKTSESLSRVELRLAEPLNAQRTRVNCTLTENAGARKNTLYWLGLVLNQP
jgi:peptidoglycan/xylan/chitin deacetylase (PgdA/CDA1 family)